MRLYKGTGSEGPVVVRADKNVAFVKEGWNFGGFDAEDISVIMDREAVIVIPMYKMSIEEIRSRMKEDNAPDEIIEKFIADEISARAAMKMAGKLGAATAGAAYGTYDD